MVNVEAYKLKVFRFTRVLLLRAKVPLIVSAAVNVTPALLLMVILLTVWGKPVPVTCAALPL